MATTGRTSTSQRTFERGADSKVGPPAIWSRRDAVETFSHLPTPQLAELRGKWEGEFVGRPALVRLQRAIAMATPLRGWCGKEFTDTHTARNLVRRGDRVKPSVIVKTSAGISQFDGQPVVAVSYADAPPPVRWSRGELRWLSPGEEILSLLTIGVGHLWLGPFPFRLTRSPS